MSCQGLCTEFGGHNVTSTTASELTTLPDFGGSSRLATLNGTLWPNGSMLKIQFLGGSSTVQSKVKQYASQWLEFANLSFKWVTYGPSDIRIAFQPGQGSFSMIGTFSRTCAPTAATMNLELHDESPERDFSCLVLHEFGHAIGCVHEHQSPAGGIRWRVQAVLDFYRNNFGWSESTTRVNVIDKYNSTQTQFSAFDPWSIMIYSFPPELTEDGFSVPFNTSLSATDKSFIMSRYPGVMT